MMTTPLLATAVSTAERNWPALVMRLRGPAIVWSWTYRVPLLKALFTVVVIAWTLPSAYRAVLSPHFAKTLFLLVLFALIILRKSLKMSGRNLFSPKEPTQ